MLSPAYGQPDYLRPLLGQIESASHDQLTGVLLRVYERTVAGVYSPDDLAYIARTLADRADRSPETRPEIITLLGQIGRPESVPIIMGYLRADDETVRMSAHQALGWIGDARPLPVLESLAADLAKRNPDSYENFLLSYAIGAIKVKQQLLKLPEEKRLPLIRSTLLDEPNWLIRADIARNLERWPGEEAWDVVFDSFGAWRKPPAYADRLGAVLTARYEFAPEGFLRKLRTRPTAVRVFGLKAIQNVANPADMSALMELSETDPDAQVRQLAAGALGTMMRR